jgi:chromosome segregation ATPase
MSNDQYEAGNSTVHANGKFKLSSRNWEAMAEIKPPAVQTTLSPSAATTPSTATRATRQLGMGNAKRKATLSPEQLKKTVPSISNETGIHQISQQINGSMQDIVHTNKATQEKLIDIGNSNTTKLEALEKSIQSVQAAADSNTTKLGAADKSIQAIADGVAELVKLQKDALAQQEKTLEQQQKTLEHHQKTLDHQTAIFEQWLSTSENSTNKQVEALKNARSQVSASIEKEVELAKRDVEAMCEQCLDRAEQALIEKAESVAH